MSADSDLTQLDLSEVVAIGNPWHGKVFYQDPGSGLAEHIETDGSITATFPTGRLGYPDISGPWISWGFTKAGQPEPTTTPAETAEGKQWRNSIVAPAGLRRSHSPYRIGPIPFVDDSGAVWMIDKITYSVGGGVSITLVIFPVDHFDITTDTPVSSVTFTKTWAAGTYPLLPGPGWDEDAVTPFNHDPFGPRSLLDISADGRSYLFEVQSRLRQYDDRQDAGGIVSLDISGTLVVDGSTATGIDLDLTIHKTSEECKRQVVSTDIELEGTPFPTVPESCTGSAEYVITADYIQTTTTVYEFIKSAFFDISTGDVVYVRFKEERVEIVDLVGSMRVKCDSGANFLSCSSGEWEITNTREYSLCSDTDCTEPIVFESHVQGTLSAIGACDDYEWTWENDYEHTFNGVTIESWSESGAIDSATNVSLPYVGGLDSMLAAVFPIGVGYYDKFDPLDDNALYTLIVPFRTTSNVTGLAYGVTDEFPTGTNPLALQDISTNSGIAGWISPVGNHTGITPITGVATSQAFGFQQGGSAYNSLTGDVAVNERYRVFYI